MILFDRHYYDILVDNKRYGINSTGQKVAKKLSWLLPTPDAVIILTAKEKQLMQRKPDEVPEEILSDLLSKYRKFYLNNVNVYQVVNDKSLEEFKSEVNEIILKSLK